MAEKSPSEITREIRLLFQKGCDALLRENYDYAVDLLNQVLEKEPTLFDARKALRAAQSKKSGSGTGGGGFFKKAWGSASSSPMIAKAQLALRSNPADALVTAEHVLNGDPTNSGAHRIVVDAANALELPRTAVMSLEILHQNSPHDKALTIQFSEALAAIGESSRAESILLELARAIPRDADIAQALKNVSARRTLGEGGYEALAGGEGSYRDILRNETEAVSLEQEKRMQKTEDVSQNLIAVNEARLKAEPTNLKLMRTLAELYTQQEQFERALGLYAQIKATDSGSSDATLDAAIAQIKVRQYEQQLKALDQTSAEYAEKAAALKAEKANFQIAECQKRVERFPTDLSIRFEMGVLYFQAGKIGEAIQEFQKAQQNPHKRIAAMNYLAQCFAKRKMYDLGAKTLQNAIKEKVVFDDEKKELIYNLGCIFEGMGKKDEAVEQFKLIYETDIGYKDVAKKVDNYYAGQ